MPVRKTDVMLGRPLPYSLYDGDRKLLLRAGCIVETTNQLERLSEKGLYRKPGHSHSADRRDGIGPETDNGNGKGRETEMRLDELKLSIGDTFQLQGAADGDASRYSVKLIGYLKGKSVMVTAPMVGENFAFIREGQAFIVRLFSGKTACAFAATVFKSANTPFPHLHLTYPTTVRGLVVRRNARARVAIIASATGDGGRSGAGTICDLSLGGALMVSHASLGEIGSTVKLSFRVMLNNVEHYLHPGALIRSISSSDGSVDGIPSGFQHGLEFIDVPAAETMALTALVYENLLRVSAMI